MRTDPRCIQQRRERLQAQGAFGKEAGATGWAVGKSKVFLRAGAQTALDLARDAVLESFVVKLQCGARRYSARKRHLGRLRALQDLGAACDARDAGALRAALGLVAAGGESGLPGGGAHLPSVRRARRLLEPRAEVGPVDLEEAVSGPRRHGRAQALPELRDLGRGRGQAFSWIQDIVKLKPRRPPNPCFRSN